MVEFLKKQPKAGSWTLKLLKFTVLILAMTYIMEYLQYYDIVGLFWTASPAYLAAACVLSLMSFMLQILFLKKISEGRLGWMDAFNIEYYAFLMNLGVASSFFSLPKIALINHKIKDLKESMKLFTAPVIVGVSLRTFIIAATAAYIYAGAWTVMILTAIVAGSLLYTIISRRDFVRRVTMTPVDIVGEVLCIGAMNMVCFFIAYYFVLLSLGVSPPVPNAALAESLSYMAGLFSPMPAGLGVREFALTEMNTTLSVSKDVALAAAILHRGVVVINPLLAGALTLAVSGFVTGKRVAD